MENDFYENFLLNLKQEHNNNKIKVKTSYSSKNVLPKDKDVDFLVRKANQNKTKSHFRIFFSRRTTVVIAIKVLKR